MRSATDKTEKSFRIIYLLFTLYYYQWISRISRKPKNYNYPYIIETANLIKNLTKFFIIKNRSKIRYRERSECPSLDWRFS